MAIALLAALLLLGMTACGGNGTQATPTPDTTSNPSLAGTASPTAGTASDEKFQIGIVQYMEHGALDKAREGFEAALNENGYKDRVEIDFQNAQSDASNLNTIADRFVGNKVDLILAIATPAAQSMAGKTTEIPILATAVTDFVSAKLVNSDEAPGTNVSGTSDMNPIAEQIDLLVRLAPDAKTVGVIYTSSEDNSVLQASLAKEAIEAKNLAYTEVTVTNTNDVQQAMQQLVTKCDAIYIPTDNVLASSMPIVYGVTAETKTPVLCGEANMVNQGGLATLGIDYYELGYQTGLMAIKVLEGEDISNMAVQKPEKFEFAINKTIAEEFGITIPEDLQQYLITPEAE